jgi:septal ring factor EnvC (AmiA/AmiB activator)
VLSQKSRSRDTERVKLAVERRRLDAESIRLAKMLFKRDAEISVLRDRLARSETLLTQASAQIKLEQGKFARLLSRSNRARAPVPLQHDTHKESSVSALRLRFGSAELCC